jgi:hypothetical protein
VTATNNAENHSPHTASLEVFKRVRHSLAVHCAVESLARCVYTRALIGIKDSNDGSLKGWKQGTHSNLRE